MWSGFFHGESRSLSRKTTPTSLAEDNNTGANLDQLTGKTEQFIENNSRNLIIAIGAVAALIVAIVGYGKFIVEPAETEANEHAWRAEQYFMMDSVDLALNGDGLYPACTRSRTTTAAPRRPPASYEIGIVLRQQGDYAGAIDAFNSADLKDDVLPPSPRSTSETVAGVRQFRRRSQRLRQGRQHGRQLHR